MSKRVNASVPEELYEWLKAEAEKMGLTPTTMVVVLLTEARRARENQAGIATMFEKMRGMTPGQLQALVEKELANHLPE